MTANKTGNNIGNNIGNKTGNKIGNKTGNKNGNKTGNIEKSRIKKIQILLIYPFLKKGKRTEFYNYRRKV